MNAAFSALLAAFDLAFAPEVEDAPRVRVAMIVPPEGPALADCAEKLDVVLKDVQWWYSCQMEAHGHGAKTFTLELDDDGKVVVHTVRLTEPLPPTTDTKGRRSAVVIAAERVLGDPRERAGTVMLLAYNGYYWSDRAKHEVTPMGFGLDGRWAHLTGWHLGGIDPNGWSERTPIPELSEHNRFFAPIATKVYQSSGRDGVRSVGERCSVSHGTFLHEMGHAFGLHHPTSETPLVYGDVMTGDGYWNTRGNFVESVRDQWCCLTPSEAAILDANPLFGVREVGLPSSRVPRSVGMRGVADASIARSDFAPLEEDGSGFTIETLDEGRRSQSNRDYAWIHVPPWLRGFRYTRTAGGETARISVRTLGKGRIVVATAEERSATLAEAGWRILPSTIAYASKDMRRVYPLYLYSKDVAGRARIEIPQREWTGTLVLAPPR